MKKTTAGIIVAAALSAGCATPTLGPTTTPTQGTVVPVATAVPPTEIPTAAPTDTPTSTPTASPTPEPTVTPIPSTPTPVPRVLTPADFSFPVGFEGPYAVGHPVAYAPCYHWDPDSFSPDLITPDNWYEFFHGGDMYVLNTSVVPERIIVLSPVKGSVREIEDQGPNGLLIRIETEYVYDGRRVYVYVAHVTAPFPDDEQDPSVAVGSFIRQGDPIAVQHTIFQWGRPEQALDIGIRTGLGSDSPLYGDWDPDDFVDPFPFLSDDLSRLGPNITFDYYRQHCLKSGHFP